METTLTSKDWQTIAIQVMRNNEKFQAQARKINDRLQLLQVEVNMLREKRGIYNGVEMQLAMISVIIPLSK